MVVRLVPAKKQNARRKRVPARVVGETLPDVLLGDVFARIQAGREAPLDAARLELDEVDQRPDLFLGQLPAPGGHLPAVALFLDLAVVDGLEDVRVGPPDAEEQSVA